MKNVLILTCNNDHSLTVTAYKDDDNYFVIRSYPQFSDIKSVRMYCRGLASFLNMPFVEVNEV